MQNLTMNDYRNLAIILIYAILLGTSAYEKLKSFTIPEWFTKQFATTPIGKSAFLTKSSYWVIAFIELALTICFISSMFSPACLAWALIGSLFLFSILCFGLRLSYDFQGSANMFTYFGCTLISLYLVTAS